MLRDLQEDHIGLLKRARARVFADDVWQAMPNRGEEGPQRWTSAVRNFGAGYSPLIPHKRKRPPSRMA